jgi:hypothetical protein
MKIRGLAGESACPTRSGRRLFVGQALSPAKPWDSGGFSNLSNLPSRRNAETVERACDAGVSAGVLPIGAH